MFIAGSSDRQRLFFHMQKVWKHLGETEPHWSAATSGQFKADNINEALSEFYSSVLKNVATLFKTFERNGIDHGSFKTCLEYGCARVSFWLTKRFESLIAYDISRSHLRLAGQYLDEAGLRNASLDHISELQEIGNFPKVDVTCSIIILQHNPPPIIGLIVPKLIRALNSAGIALFQVPTCRSAL